MWSRIANAAGGHLLIGIEDDADSPPKTQKISDKQVEELRKRIGELTINVLYTVKKCSDENGGEYIDLSIEKTMKAPTSTTDGQYLIRVGDHSRPMRPEELSHFMTDRAAFNWELQKSTV
jgi:ATP-dependent DNA helicase RecG